jgi:hypothetical protein
MILDLKFDIYLSESGSTHQEIERELHKILREHGLSSVNYEREPCDHLAVILEFVSWLDEQTGTDQQRDAWQKTQKLIIEKYLLTWLPKFNAQSKLGNRSVSPVALFPSSSSTKFCLSCREMNTLYKEHEK